MPQLHPHATLVTTTRAHDTTSWLPCGQIMSSSACSAEKSHHVDSKASNFDITVKLLILNWSLVSPIAGAPAIIAYAKREMHT